MSSRPSIRSRTKSSDEIQASGGPHQVENHVASAPQVGLDDVRRAGVVEDHFGVQQSAVDAQRFNTRGRGVHDAIAGSTNSSGAG